MTASLLLALTLSASPAVGSVAPDFTVTDTDGHVHHLDEMVKVDNVILAFFPKAFTGGCTRELSAYRDRYTEVQKARGQLLAVSMDDGPTLARFKASLHAPFAFVPDPDGRLVRLYDVKLPVLALAQRATFVIGPGRKVLRVDTGSDAINPDAAVKACPLRRPAPAP